MTRSHETDDYGSAVVDFVLIMVLLMPLVLGILQVGLVLHVRNTMVAAASEGARYGAAVDATAADGAKRAQHLIRTSIADRYARNVSAVEVVRGGRQQVVVSAHTSVPALGLGGPGFELVVRGHATKEVAR